MTRPSFTSQTRGSGLRSTNGDVSWISYTILDAQHCQEVIFGTHRRKPVGWLAPTPYSFRRIYYKRQFGEYQWKYTSSNRTHEIGYLSTPANVLDRWNAAHIVSDAFDQELLDKALISARNKLKNMKVDLGTAFAERRQTAELVGDTAFRIARSALALRKGDWRRSLSYLGVIPKKGKRYHRSQRPKGSSFPRKWLELQYGWKPLLSDVHGALSALENRDRSDWRVTSKGGANKKVVYPTYTKSENAFYTDTVCFEERRCYVRIDAIPSNDSLASLSSVGVTNPLNVAWELVPFSFVVDWFVPVGSYLQSLDALTGYDDVHVSTTHTRRTRWDTSCRFREAGFKGVFTECYKEDFSLERSVGTSVPFPTRPHVKDPLSLGHFANAMSLLVTAFGKSR